MDSYIGTKIVRAEPMEKAAFSFKVRSLEDVTIQPDGHSQEGYKVMYEDGYVSWSPKDVFERAYRRITNAEVHLIVTGE